MFEGIGLSPGTARGPVAVLPRESPVKDGEIAAVEALTYDVVDQTDLDGITGIITESEGLASHSAVYARELDLPAVGCPGILAQLEDGDEIEVDGDEGRVRFLG